MEDPLLVLTEFVSSIDNLPSEMAHIFTEMREKEFVCQDLKLKIAAKETSLQKAYKASSMSAKDVSKPKETAIYEKAKDELNQLTKLSNEKLALAERAWTLVTRHLNKLNVQLDHFPEIPPPPPIPKFKGEIDFDSDVDDDTAYYQQRFGHLESLKHSHSYEAQLSNKRHRTGEGITPLKSLLNTPKSSKSSDDTTPYCFCQQPSFGEMIACDALDCEYEWFHLQCVGLAGTPDGSWICSDCTKKGRHVIDADASEKSEKRKSANRGRRRH